jgi:tRNA modification GTPase
LNGVFNKKLIVVRMHATDTIVAIATPPGRGGVGIVRVSGKALLSLAAKICGLVETLIKPRVALHVQFRDGTNEIVDDGIALYFAAPASFTGEDVLELQAHGSPMVLAALVRRCIELGARHAEPGEFTKRAYLNGKLDLAQAEAVADVIDAATESAARAAVRSLTGEFSKRIQTLQEAIIQLRMFVEATLDFPEEDVEFIEQAKARHKLAATRAALVNVMREATRGQLLHDGVKVVLAGEPNVGKSSLLNALSGEDIAIVTPIAGTTRDTVKSRISLKGLPVEIIDTAGLRDTGDEVEKIGIARTRAAIVDADLALLVVDATDENVDARVALLARELPTKLRRMVVRNKIDLLPTTVGAVPPRPPTASPQIAVEPLLQSTSTDAAIVHINASAKTNEGIDALIDAITQAVGFDYKESGTFSARERHVTALHATLTHIDAAVAHLDHIALELFAEELRLAHQSLGEITGEFSADDLLGEIFSRFCIGK